MDLFEIMIEFKDLIVEFRNMRTKLKLDKNIRAMDFFPSIFYNFLLGGKTSESLLYN